MKRLLTTLILFVISVTAFAQAENSKHYIEGDFESVAINGKFKYTLSNIVYNGIESSSGTYLEGDLSDKSFARFIFKEVKTPYEKQFNNVLFYRWQNNKWQIDSETDKGQKEQETQSIISIVLVLDCSSSLGTDFSRLQQSAIQFIETIYTKSSNGNVKIGIVGFNSMKNTDKMILPIQDLNPVNKQSMLNFINRLEQDKNTALYYAIRKGVSMIDDYAKSLTTNDYNGSYVVTFTDGYDNESMDAMLGSPADGKTDPFFINVKEKMLTKIIKGKPIVSFMIALQGTDIGDNKDMFENILQDLCNAGNFKLAKNFDEVNLTFKAIADNLINRWTNLSCYVPPRFKGKVRWTLDDGDIYVTPIKKDPIQIKKMSNKRYFIAGQLLGVKAGFMDNWGFAISIGADLIYTEFSMLGSLSKKMIRKNQNQWNISFISGLHNTLHYNEPPNTGTVNYLGLTFGFGTDISFNHLYINFDNYIDMEGWYHIMTGVGYRF